MLGDLFNRVPLSFGFVVNIISQDGEDGKCFVLRGGGATHNFSAGARAPGMVVHRRLRLLFAAAYSKFTLDESPRQEYNAKL